MKAVIISAFAKGELQAGRQCLSPNSSVTVGKQPISCAYLCVPLSKVSDILVLLTK